MPAISPHLRRSVSGGFLMVLFALWPAPRAHADAPQTGPNFVVNSTTDADSGACGATTCSLREAINAANNEQANNSGATITFDATVFATAQTIRLTQGGLNLKSNVSIIGPTLPLAGVTVSAENRSYVFSISSGITVALSGVTMANGASDNGGGIANNGGNLALSHCTLSDNTTEDFGGGIYNNNGTLTMDNCSLSKNQANEGGGIFNSNGTLIMNYCALSNNFNYNNGGGIYSNGTLTLNNCILSANSSGYGNSGGIENDGSSNSGTLTLNNCTLFANSSSNGDSGGISNSGTLLMNNCMIARNHAYKNGGGIYNTGGTLLMNNCALAGNEAVNGAGIYSSNGTLTINNCAVSGSKSAVNGGGVYNNGTLTLNNCTLSTNSAGYGGGLLNAGALKVNNCTLSANSGYEGGGMYLNKGSLTMNNTIVAGNNANIGSDIKGPVNAGDYNLVQSTAGTTLTGSHNITGQAPHLGPLANNGGPTPTMALQSGSPAINAGTPHFELPLITDQRGPGYARVAAGRQDIGAFEAQSLCDLVLHSVAYISLSGVTPQITYRLTLTNSGPDVARGITLTDDLPRFTTCIAFTQNSGPPGVLTQPQRGGPDRVTGKLPILPPGATATFTLVLRDSTEFTLVNTTTVITSTTETSLTNNTTTSRLILDHTPPVVSIATPRPGALLNQLDLISGRAMDTVGGTGVQQVLVSLIRVADGQYFNGTTFVTPTQVNGVTQYPTLTANYDQESGIWAVRSNLPTSSALPISSDLTPGGYRILVIAIDGVGNRSQATSSFTVPTSTITLSAASASVAQSSVTLKFIAALNAVTASDTANYVVLINGQGIASENANYNTTTHTVTLDLPRGSVQAGASVMVLWGGLADAQGAAVAGQVGPLTAR